MSEQRERIEEIALKAMAANLKQNAEEFNKRKTAMFTEDGRFDIGTVEELGLDFLGKNKKVLKEMYEQLLNEMDKESVDKKKLN